MFFCGLSGVEDRLLLVSACHDRLPMVRDGVSGDWTFGNAPTFYQQKHRGNKKAAKAVFDWFIKKYLD
jgi:hypothetical protein